MAEAERTEAARDGVAESLRALASRGRGSRTGEPL